jgi:hypothetical protein
MKEKRNLDIVILQLLIVVVHLINESFQWEKIARIFSLWIGLPITVFFLLVNISSENQELFLQIALGLFTSIVAFAIIYKFYLDGFSVSWILGIQKSYNDSKIIAEEISRHSKITLLIKDIHEKGYGNRFNPRIYKKLGIEVDERQWIETISRLVQSGKAIEQLDLNCPDCNKIINSYLKYKDIPLHQTIKCNHCTHEFEISEGHIILMYSFSENFDISETEKHSGILAKKD